MTNVYEWEKLFYITQHSLENIISLSVCVSPTTTPLGYTFFHFIIIMVAFFAAVRAKESSLFLCARSSSEAFVWCIKYFNLIQRKEEKRDLKRRLILIKAHSKDEFVGSFFFLCASNSCACENFHLQLLFHTEEESRRNDVRIVVVRLHFLFTISPRNHHAINHRKILRE